MWVEVLYEVSGQKSTLPRITFFSLNILLYDTEIPEPPQKSRFQSGWQQSFSGLRRHSSATFQEETSPDPLFAQERR